MLKPENPRLPVALADRSMFAPIANSYGDYVRTIPLSPRSRTPLQSLPEVWGQYNNYRSAGLKGSLLVHAILVGLIFASALFSHRVVQQVKQREVVTLVAPSPD